MAKIIPVEQRILTNINRSLAGYCFASPELLKKHILNPHTLGDVCIPAYSPNKKDEFFMGLTYQLMRKVNANETNIEGIIIDLLGIGYVKGVESNIDGFKGLKFDRYPISLLGTSKDIMLTYECSSPAENLEFYEGKITGERYGQFKAYHNNASEKILLALEKYYNNFMRTASMRKEVQGVKNGW